MKKKTRLIHAGRSPEANYGIVNPPVYHASTVTFPTVAELERASKNPLEGVYYGLMGTPTTFALQDGIAELEGYEYAVALPSGLAAITTAILAYVGSGDHVLMVDNVYGPTRRFCDRMLSRLGVSVTYYDPMIGEGIAELMRPETRVVFTEAPGSLTFEVQDLPAISKAAHAGGAKVILDNTWSGGLYLQPAPLGVDVSLQAVTKYIGGHSDLMLGSIAFNKSEYSFIREAVRDLGIGASPDDCFMALRGLRSLEARLPVHQENGLKLASWLESREEVETILHPAFPSCPGHDVFKRDFTGSSGLFSIILRDTYTKEDVARMLDGMKLFPMGYSWGGFESLIIPAPPKSIRTATTWESGPVIRIHAGLEDADDLISDLEKGLQRLSG